MGSTAKRRSAFSTSLPPCAWRPALAALRRARGRPPAAAPGGSRRCRAIAPRFRGRSCRPGYPPRRRCPPRSTRVAPAPAALQIAFPPHLAGETKDFFLLLEPHQETERLLEWFPLVREPVIRRASSSNASSMSTSVRTAGPLMPRTEVYTHRALLANSLTANAVQGPCWSSVDRPGRGSDPLRGAAVATTRRRCCRAAAGAAGTGSAANMSFSASISERPAKRGKSRRRRVPRPRRRAGGAGS